MPVVTIFLKTHSPLLFLLFQKVLIYIHTHIYTHIYINICINIYIYTLAYNQRHCKSISWAFDGIKYAICNTKTIQMQYITYMLLLFHKVRASMVWTVLRKLRTKLLLKMYFPQALCAYYVYR